MRQNPRSSLKTTRKGLIPLVNPQCLMCQANADLEPDETNAAAARRLGISKDSVRRHRKHLQGYEPVRANTSLNDPFFTDIPLEQVTSRGTSRRLEDGSWEKISYRPVEATPEWPVVDRAANAFKTSKVTFLPARKWKVAVAGADSQIGFRSLESGLDPFHDDRALALFNSIVEGENPDSVLLCGDILDFAEQGKYTQEAAFANTTQLALDRTHEWLADMRSKTAGDIHLIEGNHDKRLQNFVELNAKAAFGLRRAGWPDSWPVMSLPYLLRLDDLNVSYYDAYPNAHVWLNNVLRAEHGDKVNSKGSTAQRYLDETPHVSRVFGHTHRQEVVSRTTWDRMGKIRSSAINPGCLCRVDGAVPSVHGSIGANGAPATVYENWQQGAAVIRYTDDEFFVELIQFEEGRTVYKGQELRADVQ